jgi:putative hydrolase of the HAD superfamily
MAVVRGVLFDFHETLISADRWMAMETGGIAVELLQQPGLWNGDLPETARQQVEHTYARLRAVSGTTGLEYSAREIGRIMLRAAGRVGSVADVELEHAVQMLYRHYLPDVTLKPGALNTLKALSRLGVRMGIVSNAAYGPFLSWALEAHDARYFFETIVVSAQTGVRKPRPEIFAAALETMRLPAGEAVYVGNDYLKDVIGAKLAGLRAIWVPDAKAMDFRDYVTVAPDAVAERLDLIPAIVRDWSTVAPEEVPS